MAAPFNASSPWNTPLAVRGVQSWTSLGSLFSSFTNPGISHWPGAGPSVAVWTATGSDPQVNIYFHSLAYTNTHNGTWARTGNDGTTESTIMAGATQLWGGYEYNPYSTANLAADGPSAPADYHHRSAAYWTDTPYAASGHTPADDVDGMLVIIQPNGWALEMYSAIQLSNGDYVALAAGYVDTTALGIGRDNGRRASMLPALGGLIRNGEITAGVIPHALCVSIGKEALQSAIAWPAVAVDSVHLNYSGTVPMGGLLAIPPGTTIASLGLATATGTAIATAAQDYGIFVGDQDGSLGFIINTSVDASDIPNWSGPLAADLLTILSTVQLAGVPVATTYYVATAGSSGNNGLTSGAPKQTYAQANALAISGDSVLGNGGDTFPATMTPVAGVTYGAYGTGKPFLSGADLVGTWTADAVSPTTTTDFEAGTNGTWGTGGTDDTTTPAYAGTHSRRFANNSMTRTDFTASYYEIVLQVRVDSSSTGGSSKKTRLVTMEGSTWNNANLVGCWITANAGNFYLDLNRGGSASNTAIISTDTWHTVRLCVTSNGGASTDHAELYLDGVLKKSLTGLSLTALAAQATIGVFGYDSTLFAVNVDNVLTYTSPSTGGASNVWKATLAGSTPTLTLTYDRTWGARQASKAACTTTGHWYHDTGANLLYLYTTVDPATYVAPGVEAGQRDQVIIGGTTDDVTLDDLEVMHGNSASDSMAAFTIGSSGLVVSNCRFRFARLTGLFSQSSGARITDSDFSYNEWLGLDNDSAADQLVQDCTATGNIYGAFYAGALSPTIDNFTYRRLTVVGGTGCANGILVDNCGSGLLEDCSVTGVQYNAYYLKGNSAGIAGLVVRRCTGLATYNGVAFHVHKDAAGSVSLTLDHCVGSSPAGNYGFQFEGAVTVLGYHLDAWGNLSHGIYQQTAGSSVTLKNCISSGNTGDAVRVSAGTLTETYNDFYGTVTGLTRDATTLNANPLFVNAAGGDFTLDTGSPAIDAGVVITDINDGGNGSTAYSGSAPDLGAFEGGITAALSGTATAGITEADIVAGGKTIILTLTGTSWIPS